MQLTARFRSESDPPPKELAEVGDETRAAQALGMLRRQMHLVYRGDERGARQLFAALKRRIVRPQSATEDVPVAERFHRERARRLNQHRTLGGLLVELDGQYRLELAHASDVRQACEAAWGPPDGEPTLVPLRELLGVIGAFEWQRRGIEIPGVGPIRPRYGVFAPTRFSYVELCAEAPPPTGLRVLEVGTGTGVLACLMAKRGAREVIAVDSDPRAVECAKDNVRALGLENVVRVVSGDLFAGETADRYLFNPPWLPGTPKTPIERGIFDPKSALLERYLEGLGSRLGSGNEGWLVLSDLAERLGLRAPDEVEERARRHGLELAWMRSRPSTSKPAAGDDPIALARSQEQVLLRCYVRR